MSGDDREQLIAYLDGELDAEAARQVEARLHQDPAARAEAEALRRTWDLLDYLPQVEPSPAFTHRTLERVTAQHVAAVTTLYRRRRWRAAVGWAAVAAAAAAAGFVAVTLTVPREPTDDELARDLRVLENRRLYEQADSLEFLKALDNPELFGDDGPEAGG